jgi:hypothetical protein
MGQTMVLLVKYRQQQQAVVGLRHLHRVVQALPAG